MIKLNSYTKEVEQEFLRIVEKIVENSIQEQIIENFKKYVPKKELVENLRFNQLILADYETLMQWYKNIDLPSMNQQILIQSKDSTKKKCFTALYQTYHDNYDKLIRQTIANEKLNVFLTRNSKTYTCPYCNRNYITCRGKKAAGAQLDHFLNRKTYPIFSLSLYNLVPCCNVCNLIKGKKPLSISPFSSELDDDSITFETFGSLLNNNLTVQIKPHENMTENVNRLRLQEAYDMHKDDLKELLELQEMYPASQLYEICQMINTERRATEKSELTPIDIRNMVFGKQIPYEEYGKKPLSKFKHDILKKWEIYD